MVNVGLSLHLLGEHTQVVYITYFWDLLDIYIWLCPRTWAYISGKSLMAMVQLLNIYQKAQAWAKDIHQQTLWVIPCQITEEL